MSQELARSIVIAVLQKEKAEADAATAAADAAATKQSYSFTVTFSSDNETLLVRSFQMRDDNRIGRVLIVPDGHEDMKFAASRRHAYVHADLFVKASLNAAESLEVPPTRTTLAMLHVPSGHALHSMSWDNLPDKFEIKSVLSRFVLLYFGMLPTAYTNAGDKFTRF
jgi:hypothetical protein